MEKLESLSSITKLSDRVVRVLGQNPGKFTLQGTNTYLLGTRNPYTLIDTGEGRSEYIPVLESALRDAERTHNPEEPDVSDIIISHWHHDHVGGLPAVLALLRKLWGERNDTRPLPPPRLHKFPLKSTPESTLSSIIDTLPKDAFQASVGGSTFHDLHDSQTLSLTSPGLNNTSAPRVLHTPGHTTDSICIYIPDDRALYTADTVLGQGTAVFEDLALYIASLKKMVEFGATLPLNAEGKSEYILYPGHGPVISDGHKLISTYIQHRLEREDQIVQVLKTSPEESRVWTIWTIVKTIYAAYPESLWLPAAHGVGLHLRKLEGEGRVKHLGGDGRDAEWELK